jgi:hypothetical protein
MQTWIVDALGGVMSSLALLLIAIWVGVYAREGESLRNGTSHRKPKRTKATSHAAVSLLIAVVVLASGSAVFQIISAFQRHATDTQLIRYYDDQFSNMTQKRKLAASALEEYMIKKKWSLVTNNTDGLDDVLNFFDALGNDVRHGAISANVAHEYFQADIAPYYQASQEYISESRTNEGDSEATFEFIKPLYDDVQRIEAKKANRTIEELRLSDSALKIYLDSEINAANLKDAK